jgi:branched-chain amino acid transport system ATP-binding protein
VSADLLTVEDLSIEFAGVKALQELAFRVPAEGVTAIIGPNGAGKTTLLNCVTGLYRPRGSIRFDGTELVGRPAQECTRLGIARTFQTPALVPELSVLENTMLGAHARTTGGVLAAVLSLRPTRGRDRALAQEARDVLTRLVPEVAPDAPVTGLPHRERRLVEIARGLLGHPRLLLLDEPAAGSTAAEATEMLARTQAVAEEAGSVIVLVEHNVPLVMSVARHVVVLDHGALLAQGTPAQVRADERVVEAYLGAMA